MDKEQLLDHAQTLFVSLVSALDNLTDVQQPNVPQADLLESIRGRVEIIANDLAFYRSNWNALRQSQKERLK